MSDLASLADRVRQLEELLSHQDHRYALLNDAVVELRSDYDRMKAKLQSRMDQLESRVSGHAIAPDPDEKPPHY